MDERNTFKAIIFCLDKHEIHPLVIIELREAFKEVAQCTVKDLHTSASDSFRLLSVYDTQLSWPQRITYSTTELHASHLCK